MIITIYVTIINKDIKVKYYYHHYHLMITIYFDMVYHVNCIHLLIRQLVDIKVNSYI